MKTTLLLVLTVTCGICFGQDTLFFNAKWEPSTRTKADFFRIDKKMGDKWTRTDYFFKTGQIQMTGTYSSLTPEMQDGYFEWFYSNGKLKHKGNYVKGKEVGEHLWYSENGNIEAKENWTDGKLNGECEEYYPNGKMIDKTSFTDGLQTGWTVYYREDGSKQAEGNFKKGNRDGEWKFYDEEGKFIGTTIFKIDYEVPEAKMFIQLPNDDWRLSNHSGKDLVEYIFKREEITDSLGKKVVPAIMLYIDDATSYHQDLVKYSLQKRLQFSKTDIRINKILIPTDKGFPFKSFRNAMLINASYSDKGIDHIFYMVYIITKDNKGIQLYMDMTKDIAGEYEKEFWTTLQSIKELE